MSKHTSYRVSNKRPGGSPLRSAFFAATVFVGLVLTSWARADDVTTQKADELQRQIDILGQEIQKMKMGSASEPTANQEDYGFGPGASKVYRVQQGVSLGGYGEILYEDFRDGFDAPGRRTDPGYDFNANNGQQRLDITRAVLYAGYKFNDHWVFNSEIEFEHAGDEIEVEFLYFDYFWKAPLNFRIGNLLMPVGLTNETHEPTTYLGAHRPLLETLIVPTSWSEYGAGFFGDYGPITYRTYLVTGLNASGFTAANGIQDGRYESGFANAEHLQWVARADYTAVPGLLAGGSFFIGDASTNFSSLTLQGVDLPVVPIKLLEAHAQYNWKAWDLRAMGAYSWLSNVDQLDAFLVNDVGSSVGSKQGGFYAQAGYDILNGSGQSLMPFLRWEVVDTQISVPAGYTVSNSNLIRTIDFGLNYKPISQLVFKTDYQWYFMGDQSGTDQLNFAMGYVF